MTLRVAFMGTPDFAVPTLEAVASVHEVVVAFTRPPVAQGRGLRQRLSPVHAAADRLGIPVETPATLRTLDAAATLRAHAPDVAVVVAYGMLLPAEILAVPRLFCLNLHASLLPRWRGAAPIQRAVMAGDAETGIAVMRMEAGLDTGPVAATARVEIGPDETSGQLHDRLAGLGAGLMRDALHALEAGRLAFAPQPDEGVTYARKITNEEARIDWSRPAADIHDRVRGLSPAPGAFFEADLGRGPERIKVLRASLAGEGVPAGPPGTLIAQDGTVACGDGAIRLLSVQRAGKAPIGAVEFLRGARLPVGAMLA